MERRRGIDSLRRVQFLVIERVNLVWRCGRSGWQKEVQNALQRVIERINPLRCIHVDLGPRSSRQLLPAPCLLNLLRNLLRQASVENQRPAFRRPCKPVIAAGFRVAVGLLMRHAECRERPAITVYGVPRPAGRLRGRIDDNLMQATRWILRKAVWSSTDQPEVHDLARVLSRLHVAAHAIKARRVVRVAGECLITQELRIRLNNAYLIDGDVPRGQRVRLNGER